MKQVLQSLKSGHVELAEVPSPQPGRHQVLIQTSYSLVSLGTEKMLLEFGKAGWLGKAQMQPEKVRQVVQKLRTDGIQPTLQAVHNKLDRPIPLGYCNVGRIVQIGPGVSAFAIGDRVVSNGAHAEMVCVPEHLCAKIPHGVSDEDAAFTFVSAIALQGVRLLEPSLGETVVVLGLGLIGLLGVQILRANGCRVIGFDYEPAKVKLAEEFGATAFTLGAGVEPVKTVTELTGGFGCDAVLITAATSSSDPVRVAPQMCRPRGRVSLVGVCDLDLSREDFYKKEIRFQVSCSYGPGRYDGAYETKNLDYPIGFVRWTVERNLQAVLNLMAAGQIQCGKLISTVADFADAPTVYSSGVQGQDVLGLLFRYPHREGLANTSVKVHVVAKTAAVSVAKVQLGVLGAGGFVGSTILPAVSKAGVGLYSICSKNGISAAHMAKKFGFTQACTDESALLHDPSVNTVIIATPHSGHARQTLAALNAGKHVFVEKPLALLESEVDALEALLPALPSGQQFMVGFNRRFAPLVQPLKAWLGAKPSGASFVMNVNAGAVESSHWTQDRDTGGGRLIGECCHFVDLLRFLADSPISQARSTFADTSTRDTFSIHLKFTSGSLGVINYFANGNRELAKERLEVFFQNQIVLLDNFKSLIPYGASGIRKKRLFSQDKGHAEQFRQFFGRVQNGGAPLIPFSELLEVARWCIRLEQGNG